jgi:TatD DNase family protein
MQLFDTHAHLYDSSLLPQLNEVLGRAREVGVRGVCCIGTDLETSRQAVELARSHSGVHAVVGFQPNHCHGLTDADWEALLQLVDDPTVVGIGETGLDRYWKDCPFEEQWLWFERHWGLAKSRDFPLVIHMRDCEADIVQFIEEHRKDWPIRGIMHSFTGNWNTASKALDAGMHISFAGMVTFKASDDLRSVARRVPQDRLLIETDSPYLSPEPLRGRRPNEPGRVLHTLRCLAETIGVSADLLAEQTTRNAVELFRLDEQFESL